MYRLTCNNRGFSLLEVVIAFSITAIAVMGVFALMAPGWRTTSRSDQTGRAANILYDQLQQEEVRIMNPCNAVVAGTVGPTTFYASGGNSSQGQGDIAYNVTTTITEITAAESWRVAVHVNWPGHTGISESTIVTRQNAYRYPIDCVLP